MLRGQNLLQFDLHGPVSDQVKLASLNGHSSKSEASTNSRGNDTLNRRVPRGKGLKHWAVAILLVVSSCSLLQIAASSLLLPAKAAAPDSGLVKTMQMVRASIYLTCLQHSSPRLSNLGLELFLCVIPLCLRKALL